MNQICFFISAMLQSSLIPNARRQFINKSCYQILFVGYFWKILYRFQTPSDSKILKYAPFSQFFFEKHSAKPARSRVEYNIQT